MLRKPQKKRTPLQTWNNWLLFHTCAFSQKNSQLSSKLPLEDAGDETRFGEKEESVAEAEENSHK